MKRKSIFLLITLLLPPFLFVVAEVSLRFFGYGEDLRLVVDRESNGRAMFAINRSVAKRYFPVGVSSLPEPAEDFFSIQKGKKTIRIFCLGESTMAGFPYEFNATGPSFLKRNLQTSFPEHDIEVINVGLAAVGTFVIRDFLNELLDYEPDLFVVYAGHNEFYGVYGPASSVGTTLSPWITDLSISLTKFKLYLALRDLLSAAGNPGETLMEQMPSRQGVDYKSDLYELTRRIYARNVEDLIATSRQAGVPIMFSAVVSNLADQPPFLSHGDPSLSPAVTREFSHHLRRADSLCESNDGAALESYTSALALDSLHAGAWFGLGRFYRQQRDSVNALRCLLRARDLDALRFRMSDDFQQELKAICRRFNVPFSPADSTFAVSSPLGLVGNELILEHLHPNLRGYALLGRTWANTIAQSSDLSGRLGRSVFAGRAGLSAPSFTGVSEIHGSVTPLDSAIGFIRTSYLTHRWPFPADRSFVFVPETPIEEIALRYVQKKIPWQTARYEAAGYYVGRSRYDLARREVSAVAEVLPFSYEPLLRLADYFVMEGRKEEAKEAYLRCVNAEDNPYAWSKLALLLVEGERFQDAVLALNNAFAAEGKTRHRLPAVAAISNRYLLGFAYAKLQKRKDAIRELEMVLARDPQHKGAAELLGILQK